MKDFNFFKDISKNSWFMHVEDPDKTVQYDIPLPTTEQLMLGTLKVGVNSLELIKTKERLIEAIMSYNIPAQYSKKGPDLFKRFKNITILGLDSASDGSAQR